MKKLLSLFLVGVGGLVGLALLVNISSHMFAGVPYLGLGLIRSLTYLTLNALCMWSLIVLWKKGLIPFGFFVIVLGGFFLGAASRSQSPDAEISFAVGAVLFLTGYMIVRVATKRISFAVDGPPDPNLKQQMLQRLLEVSVPNFHYQRST